jgi:hypothetical protein
MLAEYKRVTSGICCTRIQTSKTYGHKQQLKKQKFAGQGSSLERLQFEAGPAKID